MDRARFRRQLFFFLLAVLLPSAVLVAFGVVFLKQQAQIDATRSAEEGVRITGVVVDRAAEGLGVEIAVTCNPGLGGG